MQSSIYFLGWPPLSPHTFEHVCIIKSNGMPVKFTICWYDTTHTTIDCMPVITGKAQNAYFCHRLLKMCPRLRVRKRSNKYFTLQRLSCFYPTAMTVQHCFFSVFFIEKDSWPLSQNCLVPAQKTATQVTTHRALKMWRRMARQSVMSDI